GAQLDRAMVYETIGREFEPLRARHLTSIKSQSCSRCTTTPRSRLWSSKCHSAVQRRRRNSSERRKLNRALKQREMQNSGELDHELSGSGEPGQTLGPLTLHALPQTSLRRPVQSL